jgi:hypothetical protein
MATIDDDTLGKLRAADGLTNFAARLRNDPTPDAMVGVNLADLSAAIQNVLAQLSAIKSERDAERAEFEKHKANITEHYDVDRASLCDAVGCAHTPPAFLPTMREIVDMIATQRINFGSACDTLGNRDADCQDLRAQLAAEPSVVQFGSDSTGRLTIRVEGRGAPIVATLPEDGSRATIAEAYGRQVAAAARRQMGG